MKTIFLAEDSRVKENTINIIIDCYYIIIICPKSTLVHWQGDSLTYPVQSSCATHYVTLPILFCLRFSRGAAKEKVVTEKLEKLPSKLHTYLVIYRKQTGFPKGKIPKKIKKVWDIWGSFLAMGVGLMRAADVKFLFTLMKFKCRCVKCWISNLECN